MGPLVVAILEQKEPHQMHKDHKLARRCRSFDVDKNQHPVKWLVETLDDSIIAPMSIWLDGIVDDKPFCPEWSNLMMPVSHKS